MTLFALAGKCGFFGASGFVRAPSSAAARPSLKSDARASGAEADAALAEEMAAGLQEERVSWQASSHLG